MVDLKAIKGISVVVAVVTALSIPDPVVISMIALTASLWSYIAKKIIKSA